MKFGKLSTVDQVDFSLPPDPPGNATVFKAAESEKCRPALYIGATGWGMKEWVGTVYPRDAKPQDYLYHYTRQFNTIELNTTHYRIPDELTIKKWYDQSAADFRFCPKVLQRISHSRDLSPPGPASLVRQFCDAVAGLQEKLGPCFVQLPPYFGADRLPVLETFLQNWSSTGIPLAVEVRHESWFDDPETFEALSDRLKKYQASAVITDVAGRRDVCHMGVTTEKVLIRFVGNGLHPTDFKRIDRWAERLRSWFAAGVSEVYFFTHEPDNILSPELAVYLAGKMKNMDGIHTRGPVLHEQPDQGRQMSLF